MEMPNSRCWVPHDAFTQNRDVSAKMYIHKNMMLRHMIWQLLWTFRAPKVKPKDLRLLCHEKFKKLLNIFSWHNDIRRNYHQRVKTIIWRTHNMMRNFEKYQVLIKLFLLNQYCVHCSPLRRQPIKKETELVRPVQTSEVRSQCQASEYGVRSKTL